MLNFFSFPLAYAMGSRRPAPTPTPSPLPPTETIPPKPVDPIGEKLPIDSYKEIANNVGFNVDKTADLNELSNFRTVINQDYVDSCLADRFEGTQFSEAISFFVQEMLEDTPARVSYISSYYGLSKNEKSYYPTSLIRHPLCFVSKNTLTKTLGKNIPSEPIIQKLNQFIARINDLRQNTINGDSASKTELQREWSTWFSCLGYVESLSSADSSKSISVANKYAPENYRKPAGVKFYEDPYQSEASRLNIGLFQFSPDSMGNVQSCIQAWNEINSSCPINPKGNQKEMIKVLGSSLQTFNAFCGVHKLIQTYSIQVNTNKISASHPANVVNDKLKSSEQRCVSPHFAAGKAYNHFGPFQNSTGNNLSELITCVERSR